MHSNAVFGKVRSNSKSLAYWHAGAVAFEIRISPASAIHALVIDRMHVGGGRFRRSKRT